MNNYCIRPDYISRTTTTFKDMCNRPSIYQRKAYEIARHIAVRHKLRSVLDFGCGSAEKLLEFFSEFDTIGVDLEPTVRQLRQRHPQRRWETPEAARAVKEVDLVICADVIEHVLDPDEIIAAIERINPKFLVISTPDRDYFISTNNHSPIGPPQSEYHIREWSFAEFASYLSESFEVLHHTQFDNVDHLGQVAVCAPKLHRPRQNSMLAETTDIPIDHLRSNELAVACKEGFGGKHISFFPPYAFFKMYLNGRIPEAVAAFMNWYDVQFKRYYNIPKQLGGAQYGSLYRLIEKRHADRNIVLDDALSNLDRVIYKSAIRERVLQRFALLETIKREGYRPDNDVIEGVKKNDCIYLIGGQHRTAMSHVLGYETMPVKIVAEKKMENYDQIKQWVDSQQWYQKIELSNGIVTNGNVSISNRLKYFNDIVMKGKTFLDIGCNSGGYCLWAKKAGASRVVGMDINNDRLRQAKELSRIEKLDIEFIEKSIFEIDTNITFDVVFCIAVLTEISDVLKALDIIKKVTEKTAIIELSLARPCLYESSSRRWQTGYRMIDRQKAVMELMEYKRGYTIAPSLEIVQMLFGSQFTVSELGSGERYDLIRAQKRG